jgi:hypothetical protein
MKSATLPSFWEYYGKLDHDIRAMAKKAFRLWSDDPFYPSLRFKCINKNENIWSVRVTLNYRALGVLLGLRVHSNIWMSSPLAGA